MVTIRSIESRKVALLSLIVVAMMLLAGCDVSNLPGASTGGSNGSNGSSAKPTSTTSSQSNPDSSGNSDSPGDTPTDTPQAGAPAKVERALSTNPPVTFRYAGIDFTIKKALITNELPHFPGQYSGTEATIYLTLSGTNDNTASVDISAGQLVLTLDGTEYKQPAEIGIQSRDTQSIDFEWDNVPQTTDWNGATLNINQEGKEPVTVSLDKPQPPQYPITLTVPGTEVLAGDSPLTYTVTSAQITLDGISETQYMQADLGERFLGIKFSATNPRSDLGAYVGGDYITLRADGKPIKADWLDADAGAGVIKPLGTVNFTSWFQIPADTKSLALEVGNGDHTEQIPLTMP